MPLPETPKQFFSKVKEARELLKGKSVEMYETYMRIVQKAEDAGEYETALKYMQWLIEHAPAADTGERIVDSSVDKQVVVTKQDDRPRIQIGIQMGGVGMAKPVGPGKPLPKLTAKAEIIDAD